jgi:hypothetical protein
MHLVKVEKVAVLEIWVVLNLVDGRLDLCCLENGLKMHLQEVGDTNRFCFARLLDLLQLGPALLEVLIGLGEPRTVDQIKIHVVEAKLLKGDLEGLDSRALLLSRNLRGDIKLLPGNTSSLDSLSKLFLIAVNCEAIRSVYL